MKAVRNNILEDIDSYNSIINQRESEVKSIYNDIKIQEFYNKKEALEKHFNAFTQYKTNLKGFIKYYKQNIKQYEKDFSTYAEFIVKLKEDITETKQNKPLYENLEIKNKTEALETKAYIETTKTGINDSIKDLIIKPVPNCPGYSFGKYGDFDVIFRDKDGFINATKLCKLGGKDYTKWNRLNLEGPQKLIKALKTKLYSESTQKQTIAKFGQGLNSVSNTQNVTSFEDIIVEDTISQENTSLIIWGTYVHPKLINSIASWVSEDFALKVADIVEEYFIKKANTNLNDLIKDYQNQLVLKDDKIDTLIKKVDNQTEELKQVKQINLDQTDKINKLLSYGKKAKKALVNINSNIEDIHSKSIEPCKASIETELVLLYNNTGNDYNVVSKSKDIEGIKNGNGLESVLYPFTFIRRQRKSIRETIKTHLPFKALALKKHILKPR